MNHLQLNRVELDHLLTLLRAASQDGSYYGDPKQYRRRHDRIWGKLVAQWGVVTGQEYPLRSRDTRHAHDRG